MTRLNAISLTQDVKDWLTNTYQPRVLHVFDNACNLLNERKEILSIVTQQIGNGPFNLLVTSNITFTDHLDVQSDISFENDQLHIGNLIINMDGAKPWNPCPDWDLSHGMKDDVLNRLKAFKLNIQPALPASLLFTLATSIAANNISSSVNATQQLAGLGHGLTPAGDDFIMGTLYAAWIVHPFDVAKELSEKVAKSAVPLTTSLSAAWIRSAGRGEAGEVWHYLGRGQQTVVSLGEGEDFG